MINDFFLLLHNVRENPRHCFNQAELEVKANSGWQRLRSSRGSLKKRREREVSEFNGYISGRSIKRKDKKETLEVVVAIAGDSRFS